MPRPPLRPFTIACRDLSGNLTAADLRTIGAYGLSFTTHYRFGCMEARFTIPAQGNEPGSQPQVFQAGYDIRLSDARGCFWRGFISGLRFTETAQGRAWDVECTGYCVGLGERFTTAYNAGGKTIDQIIIDALGIATTAWETTDITTGGYTIAAATAYPNIHGAASLHAGQLLAWGAQFDQGAQWGIWAEDDGSRTFLYKPRPSSPTLYLRKADFPDTDWGYDRSPLFNEIQGEYNRGGTVALPTYSYSASSDPDSQASFGPRTLAVRLWELTDVNDVDQVLDSILALAKRPRMSSTLFRTVAREGYGLLAAQSARADAAIVAPHRIRAGELASFVDLPALDPAGVTTDFNSLAVIAQTEYDEESATLTLTPEGVTDTIGGYLARFEALAAGMVA